METAARLLKADLAEVEAASEKVTPWPHGEDPRLLFWSVRQLARHVARAHKQARRPAA